MMIFTELTLCTHQVVFTTIDRLKTDLSENKLDHLDFQVFDYFETEMVMSRVKNSEKFKRATNCNYKQQ